MSPPGPGLDRDLGGANSYYAATGAVATRHPRLLGEHRADICVIGGGCTGLSSALHLAQAGCSVVVLEAARVGSGASGRNGGQIIPGLRLGALELIARYGASEAKALFELALDARSVVLDLIARHSIDCDLRLTGHLAAAARAKDFEHLQREATALVERLDYHHVRLVAPGDLGAELAAPGYCGGLIDLRGGHLHPLNYTRGLARAAAAAGVQIYEDSAARRLELSGGRMRVSTREGLVDAERVVLAGDALLARSLAPRVADHIMPVASFIVATEPLADPAALIAHDRAVSDTRFVVNYFRRSADGRLLFGGGERYSSRPPDDIAAFAGAHMRRVFPQLSNVKIDFAWGGLVSITRTRLPHVGRRAGVYFAHGYSGLGVVLSTLAGKLIARAISGQCAEFERLAAVAPPPMPGGAWLRGPLHTLGMLWYALRDRV